MKNLKSVAVAVVVVVGSLLCSVGLAQSTTTSTLKLYNDTTASNLGLRDSSGNVPTGPTACNKGSTCTYTVDPTLAYNVVIVNSSGGQMASVTSYKISANTITSPTYNITCTSAIGNSSLQCSSY